MTHAKRTGSALSGKYAVRNFRRSRLLEGEEMAVDLDPPYEDEALYSIIARYFRSAGVTNYSATFRSIFGSGSHLCPGGPHNLDYLSDQCKHVWSWSGAEIAERLTVYPYFAALLPNKSAEQFLKQLCESRGIVRTGKALMIGVRLRYCPACLSDDYLAGRPGHWRRRHLLPGVLVCSKHQQWLREVSPDQSRQHSLLTPGSTGGLAKLPDLRLTSNQGDACVRVSQISEYLLNNRVSVLPERLVNCIKESARAAGFAYGPDRIRTRDLSLALVRHFGESFLRHVDALPVGDLNWIAYVFRGRLPEGYVHKTVLLAEFLSSVQAGTCDDAWPMCPNSKARSDHSVNLRVRKKDGYIAKCSCGFSFKYAGVVNGIPQHVKPTRYAFLAEDVIRLRKDGWTYRAIAERFRIAAGTATNLCVSPSRHIEQLPSPAVRARRIAQWRHAVREFGSAAAAGHVKVALYLWIRRYAREVL